MNSRGCAGVAACLKATRCFESTSLATLVTVWARFAKVSNVRVISCMCRRCSEVLYLRASEVLAQPLLLSASAVFLSTSREDLRVAVGTLPVSQDSPLTGLPGVVAVLFMILLGLGILMQERLVDERRAAATTTAGVEDVAAGSRTSSTQLEHALPTGLGCICTISCSASAARQEFATTEGPDN